jgi:acyl-CoA synthetase (AMP-forming)/AMP-acid ligase II
VSVHFQRLVHDGLVASAGACPSKTAVVAEDGAATYTQLLADSRSLAAWLQVEGLERGDRVGVFMENSLACVTTVLGILLAGGVVVTVNAQTKADRLTFILDDCGPMFLVAEGPMSLIAAGACQEALTPPRLVCARPPEEIARQAVDLDRIIEEGRSPRDSRMIPPDLAVLLYTSGTTGTPKGVMLTHQSLVFVTESIIEYLRLGPDDRVLNVLPMSFGYGLSQLLLVMRLSATLLLERSFAYPAQTLRRIEAEEATVVPAIPTILSTLASMYATTGRTYPSVTRITNAAAGLPPALHSPIRELFPNALIFRMYGQTECIRVCYLEPELVDQKPTSVGKAIPGTEAFVLNDDGLRMPPGEVGTLYVRGPHVMAGYWNAPELTEGMIKEELHPSDRLLCTHDLFTVDDDGDLYFVSRSDEIIKTRGEKVSPVYVENVLFSIAGVREAAVVGVPDDLLGEAIRAYLVSEDGIELEESDVFRYCRERLESFAVPHEVRFIKELPKTPSGKVRRRGLLP